MVHHDDRLGRLTEGTARLDTLTADALKRVPFLKTADRMMTLGDLLDLVSGRVPLILEIKSRFDGDTRLAQRVATVLKGCQDPVAAMSFDPEPIAALRAAAPETPRGIVAERWYRDAEWNFLDAAGRFRLAFFLHGFRTRPHFIANHVNDLPAVAPLALRRLFGLPLLTWTVRDDSDRNCARRWADQMIFEGFRP
jgi:glycerophosphoryl diester phosphodiesterase